MEANKIITEIDNGLKWIKRNQPEQYEQRFLQLVEERRKLRILADAEKCNPGIATFGQSQGKSYLMNCILQDNGSPFMVDSPDGEYNFVDEINPIGDGKEATGIVTRFSSFIGREQDYSSKYPIRFRALSVKDIILIICDTYFNDFDDFTTAGESELSQFCDDLNEKYLNCDEQNHPILKADDMLDIKSYFKQHINAAQVYSVKVPFFDRLASIIEKIPVNDYLSVFSVLWNKESVFNKLFSTCINILQRMKFEEYLYLPMSSVLHGGTNQDTIMSVSCLKLLYSAEASKYKVEAFCGATDNLRSLGVFTKSELCTVCSEVEIKIKEQFLSSTGKYDTRDIPEETLKSITTEEISMSILKECDLLYFPTKQAHANSRLSTITDEDTLMYMCSFLHCKVAYLFNKYKDEKMINILLYCHHNQNNSVPVMWQLLNSWVNDYVGNTPEKRDAFIKKTSFSPLFHIGTMFNMDLEKSVNPVGNSEKGILRKWNARFFELLSLECFRKNDVQWVDNWTGIGKPFQNSYLLRDFKFSKNIYSGYANAGKEQEMLIDREYYTTMRKMFIASNNDTHHLFANPALSFDVAASIGNDGSLYIIQQLSKVSLKIAKARKGQIEEQTRNAGKVCYDILHEYLVSDDTAEFLAKNKRKANCIFRGLGINCGPNPISDVELRIQTLASDGNVLVGQGSI